MKDDVELFAGVAKSENYFVLMAMSEFKMGKEFLYCFGVVLGEVLH